MMTINPKTVTHACIAAAITCTALFATPGAQAALIQYDLSNHPDGGAIPPPYGMRMDGLFPSFGGSGIFTFDFEAAGAGVTLTYDDVANTIEITGRAFGGLIDGAGGYSAGAGHSSFINFSYLYTNVITAPGDDDLIVLNGGGNFGTVIWEDTGELINIVDEPGNNGYAFRFGNEDNDLGHRGFNGLSGWGWITHDNQPNHVPATDWLFTATLIPAPSAALIGALGLLTLRTRRRNS